MEYIGYIYKTTHIDSGRVYVGQYTGSRKSYLGSGKVLKLAIHKYGKESFINEIITHCKSREELNAMEEFWISELKALIPNGFNIAKGAYGGFMGEKYSIEASKQQKYRWSIMAQEQKDKLINNLSKNWGKNKGIPKTQEIKDKISKKLTGLAQSRETIEKRNKSMMLMRIRIGKEVGNKISAANKNKKKPIGFGLQVSKALSKPIIQMNLDGSFIKRWLSSSNILAEFKIKNRSALNRACRGESKTYIGFIWKYDV